MIISILTTSNICIHPTCATILHAMHFFLGPVFYNGEFVLHCEAGKKTIR